MRSQRMTLRLVEMAEAALGFGHRDARAQRAGMPHERRPEGLACLLGVSLREPRFADRNTRRDRCPQVVRALEMRKRGPGTTTRELLDPSCELGVTGIGVETQRQRRRLAAVHSEPRARRQHEQARKHREGRHRDERRATGRACARPTRRHDQREEHARRGLAERTVSEHRHGEGNEHGAARVPLRTAGIAKGHYERGEQEKRGERTGLDSHLQQIVVRRSGVDEATGRGPHLETREGFALGVEVDVSEATEARAQRSGMTCGEERLLRDPHASLQGTSSRHVLWRGDGHGARAERSVRDRGTRQALGSDDARGQERGQREQRSAGRPSARNAACAPRQPAHCDRGRDPRHPGMRGVERRGLKSGEHAEGERPGIARPAPLHVLYRGLDRERDRRRKKEAEPVGIPLPREDREASCAEREGAERPQRRDAAHQQRGAARGPDRGRAPGLGRRRAAGHRADPGRELQASARQAPQGAER